MTSRWEAPAASLKTQQVARDAARGFASKPKAPKTPATLAKQIECEVRRAGKDWARYENEHCALYENDLENICPRKDKDRQKKLVRFAQQYGFRLRFYRQGLCAICSKLASQPVTSRSDSSLG
jgi:hypothetical protein